MSLTISETLNSENNFLEVNELQTKSKVKLSWDNLPEDSRIVLHYKNGTYIGVERVKEDGEDKINIIYTERVTLTEKGETIFGTDTKETEKSITIYENKI